MNNLTLEEQLSELGRQIRVLRIRRNIDQRLLAQRAGISVSALKNFEAGHGATLRTFVKTLRALGRADWLDTLAPTVSISPLQVFKSKSEKMRVSKPRVPRTRI